VAGGKLLARKTRAITRWRITESIYEWTGKISAAGPGLGWVAPAEIETAALSGPHRRWLREILAARKKIN
jgi:A/G-specific adenine glycosylase